MHTGTHILIVEDLEMDVELAQHEIRKSVKDCVFQHVDTSGDFLKALETFQPDVILSDYSLPNFNGLKALELAREHATLTPFIIWTGSMSEDVAVECMKAGANNYILKENIKRLGPAVVHAMEERQLLLERKRSEEIIRDLARFPEENPNPVMKVKANGQLVYANAASQTILEEWKVTVNKQLPDEWKKIVTRIYSENDKQTIDVSVQNRVYSLLIVPFRNEEYINIYGRDITDYKLAEERYRSIFENSAEGIFQSTPEGRYIKVNPAMAHIYGYASPKEMIGSITSIADQVYTEPGDRRLFTKLLHDKNEIKNFEMKNLCKDGSVIWTSTSARVVRDADGAILYYEGFLQDITERKQAEENLRMQEKRFRSLIENSLDNISLLAADGTLLWENPTVNSTLGYHQDAFVNHNIFELMHPDDLAWTTQTFKTLIRKPGEHKIGVFRLRHQDGTWRWIEAVATNLLEEPSVNAIVINYRDITERKQVETEIQHRNDDLKLINAINEAVIRGESLDAIVRLLANELKRIFSSEGSTIYILGPDGKSLAMQQYSLPSEITRRIERLIGSTIPLVHIPIIEGGYFEKVLHSGRGSVTSDPAEIQKWMSEFVETSFLPQLARGPILKLIPRIYKLLRIRSTIIVPLISDGKTIGLLDVSSPNLFTEDDLLRIENISGQLTAAIQRQRANEQIHRSEVFLQSIQNALSASIAILNEEGTIVQVNSAWRKFGEQNGLNHPKYGIGLNYLEICDKATGLYAEEAPIVANAIRDVIMGRKREVHIEYPCHSPEEKRWFTLQVTKFEDEDRVWVVLAHENITERTVVEQKIKETSEQFRILFEASPEAIMLVDPQKNWSILDCNSMACTMNGFTRDELVGQSVDIFNLTQDTPAAHAEYLERVREAGILRYETYHRHKDGTIFPIEVTTSLIMLGGREVVLGIDRDITHRKEAEEALRESEALYRQAMEVAGAVPYYESYYDNGRAIKYEFIGEGIRQITGYGPEEFNAKVWDSLVEEVNLVEDLKGYSLEDGIQRVRSGENPIWKCEHRIRDRYGKIHWVFEAAVELRDEHGVSHGSIGTYQDITARKQAEEAVLASEQRYRAFFEDVPIAIWEEDFSEVKKYLDTLKEQGITDFRAYFKSHPEEAIVCSNKIRILNVNNTAVQMFQAKSKDELISFANQGPSKGELEHINELFMTIGQGGISNHWEGSDETMTGKPIEINLSWSVVPGHDQDYSKVIVTTTDITERKQAENAERQQRALAEALRDTAEILNSTLEYGEVLDHILAAVGRVVPHDAATIMLIEGEFAHVVRAHGYDKRGLNDEIMGVKLSLAETTNLWQLLESRQPLIVYDTHAYTGWKRLPITDWLRSNVGAPISIQGEVIGFILLDSETVGFFTAVHAERLKAFANQAALAIHNARLLQQAQKEIVERRQAEEELRQSERRYRTVVENQSEFIVRWTPDGNRSFVNDAYRRYFGLAPEQALSTSFMPLVYEEDRPAVEEKKSRLLSGSSRVETDIHRVITPDGSIGWQEWTDQAIYDDNGQIIEFQSVGRDITERRRAENELRDSEERFRQMANNIQEVFWMTDATSGEEIYMSPASEKIWGRSIDSMLSNPESFILSVVPEDRPHVLKTITEQRKGVNTEMEYRILRDDGSIRWVWDRAFPVFNESGKVVRIAGIAADITERKELEHERDLLASTVYASLHEIYLFDAQTFRIIFVNNGALQNLGYKQAEILQLTPLDLKPEFTNESFQKLITPLLQHEKAIQIFETMHKRADGSLYPVEVHLQLIERDNERVFLAFIQDITKRKQAEEQLRKLSRAVDQSASTIVITDTMGNIEYVNSKFTETTGYTAAEAIGQNPSILKSGHTPLEEYGHLWKAISSGGKWHGEFINKKKNGELYWESATISPIINERGEATHFLAVKEDITERKQAEEELRKNEQRLRIALASTNIAVFNQDTDLRYTWMYQPQLGYTSEQVIGRTDEELLPAQDALTITKIKRRAMETGKPQRAEVSVHSGNQTTYYAMIVEPLLGSDGTTIGITGSTLDITDHKSSEIEVRRHLSEMEALYENGLAVGQLLNPREIGGRIIETFTRHLSWHHVAIRLLQMESDNLELIAFNQPGLSDEERIEVEHHFNSTISKVEQGLSGWVVQTGKPFRTGNLQEHPQYVNTYEGMQSGLYMPLKIGERVTGVISVESESPDAFTPQDERLLATLASQAAVAFENARLYQSIQQERERFSELFENSPVATWLEDFSAVIDWMNGLRAQGVTNLKEYLEKNPEEFKAGVRLIRILDVNHVAVVMNGAGNKEELINNIHELLEHDTPSEIMINELELIWRGYTSFGFEMTSHKLDGSLITGIQRIYIPASDNKPDYARVIVTSTDITDRVNFEKQLRTSEVHYRELADSITDIFFELDQNLRYSHWNKASETLTGLPAEYAIGKSMRDVFGESEEQDRIEQIYRDVLEKHQPRTFETVLFLNRLQRAFEINAYPSTRGVAVVAKDVTERKQSESLMQKRFELMEFSAEHTLEELMQKALDEISEWTHSTIGFFQLIQEDQLTPGIQVWSTDTFQHFRLSGMEEMHKPADQAGVWADAIRQRRAVIHNDYASLRGRKGLPEGHIPMVREMIVPIIRNERIMAVIGIGNKPQEYTREDLDLMERFADYAWDIIERKQMVIELAEERNQLAKRVEERTADLSRANSNLARALRVKDEFLANMSHELRTPLNAILGLSESLAEQIAGPLNDKQLKYTTTISESGHHLLSLINDILDLAKIEAGQITLDINKVDVNSVSQASLRMIKQMAQKKNLDVSMEIDKKVGLMWADERRLKQMMVNLLSNAVKFTPEGGKIGLQIDGDQDDNKVTITIWDTGIGIKQGDFERLFQPFVQLDSGLARESSGTGLGLALVAQMARMHGGSVNVQSDPGKGSRFTIVLPWEPALTMDAAERLKVTGKFRAIRPGQAQQTILLIEDTQEVVMMIKDYLEIAGYRVVTAQDGIDGITQAKLTHPDLILMDVQMPRMDGLEATQKLRQEHEFKYTPIIALTALAMPNDRERCLAAGMDEYISKPVNLRALVKIVQASLSTREEKTRPR